MKLRQHIIGTLLFVTLITMTFIGRWLLLTLLTPSPPYSATNVTSFIFLIGGSVSLKMLLNTGWIDLSAAALLSIWPLVLVEVYFYDMPVSASEIPHYISSISFKAWIPCSLGLMLAWLILRKWNSKRARVTISFHALLPTVLLVGGYFAARHVTYTRTTRISQQLSEPALSVNAEELAVTKVVADMGEPITAGMNLVWCGTFQLAWNDLCDLHGEDIHFISNEPACVERLNHRDFDNSQLDADTYLSLAGPQTVESTKAINEQVAEKFGEDTFKPQQEPGTDYPLKHMALAYLIANLPFEHPFERTTDGTFFNGTMVESFTIPFSADLQPYKKKAMKQVSVLHPPEEGTFILELLTLMQDHNLLLAKLTPEPTLAATVKKAVEYVDTLPSEILTYGPVLQIPLFNFDISKSYAELTNKAIDTENPAYRGSYLDRAEQNIRFQLDERGAAIKSNARIETVFCAPSHNYILDEPFLLMLRYRDSNQPYFAMWVDNAEILVEKK